MAGSSFRTWLLVKGVGPILFCFFVGVGIATTHCVRLGVSRRHASLGALKAVPLVLVVSFAFVPGVSMSAFQSWLCVEYMLEGADGGGISTISYLRYDLRVRCSDGGFLGFGSSSAFSSEHEAIRILALAFVCVWPIGMVLMYGAILLRCRGSLNEQKHTPLIMATKFLHRDYKVSSK